MTDMDIVDLIQAIEDKKEELKDAEYKARYLPSVINYLEIELFKKLKESMVAIEK